MPEEVTYTCDLPRCKKRGRMYVIDSPISRARMVLLCVTHSEPLEVLSTTYGKPSRAVPGRGGVSKRRLLQIFSDE